MRRLRFLQWLTGLAIVLAALLAVRSWMPGPAAAQTGSSAQVYFPYIAKDRTPTPTSTSTPTSTPTPTETPVPTATSSCPSHHGEYELQLYDMINAARANAGLAPLTPNYSLEVSAGEHSDDMAIHHNLSHTGSDGSTACQRVVAAGYPSSWCAEIIMYANTPQDAMDWWMNEPLHRQMILGPFNDFGTGYARCGDDYHGYFTVDFGHR